MLKSLKINNVAIIENAEPVFSTGLNIMTGETGAGKSIIIDSINAILGERTSRELIRTGCEKATVVAVFSDVSDYCRQKFSENDLFDDNGEYIIQRTFTKNSGSCRVNGIPVNASVLRELSKFLVNIHGQHDNQMLLDPDNHCNYLDLFADDSKELADYKKSFDEFCATRKELNKCIKAEDELSGKLDLLNFQIDELEKADITVGEYESLKTRFEILSNSEKINEKLRDALNILCDGDYSTGITELLGMSTASLKEISTVYEPASRLLDKITDLSFQLETVKAETETELKKVDFDKNELETVSERIELLKQLMRKYGNSEEKMLGFLEDAKSQISEIQFNTKKRTELEDRLVELQDVLIVKAEILRTIRAKGAEKLSDSICSVLEFLDMPDVRFNVNIEQGSYTATGTDRVSFYISANKGQKLMPLNKVASGGELSRIMLAIKSVLADADNVDTLIFDEIDTGISGHAARKIAVQLRRLSKNRQVICITHLAQIAAVAENHMLISKQSDAHSTYTSVKTLYGDDRINEVARIMSGSDITDNLYNTATELIKSELAEI